MSWKSGGDLNDEIEKTIIKFVPRNKWFDAAAPIMSALEAQDWDGPNLEEISLWAWVALECGDISQEEHYEDEPRTFEKWKKKLDKKYGNKEKEV